MCNILIVLSMLEWRECSKPPCLFAAAFEIKDQMESFLFPETKQIFRAAPLAVERVHTARE
jgi:hypothetical protein